MSEASRSLLGHCCFAGCSLVTCSHCRELRCVNDFHLCTPPSQQTRCRRCLEWNDGDPWYCDRCGKETTLTPHDGGTLGDTAAWTREKAPDA